MAGFPLVAASGISRVPKTARSRHAVSRGLDRNVLRWSAGDLFRRVGTVPAAHGGARRSAGLTNPSAVARPGVRLPGDAQSRARHRKLPALGWIPPVRAIARFLSP